MNEERRDAEFRSRVHHSSFIISPPCGSNSPSCWVWLNRITRSEYHDLYRLAALLNDKVRGTGFDFLNGTLGSQFLRESLRREVWNLEPATLSAAH